MKEILTSYQVTNMIKVHKNMIHLKKRELLHGLLMSDKIFIIN